MKRLMWMLVFCMGCGAGAMVDKQFIHGTWLNEDGTEAVSFYSDGTCRFHFPLATRDGKYQVLSDGRMKLTTSGAIWGENDEIVDYDVTATTLKIKTKVFGFPIENTLTRK